MSESVDLSRILREWPYDPEDDARMVTADDHRQILQVRTPLGIEQFELDGRPDGAKPHGLESSLEFYTRSLEQAKEADQVADFGLDEQQCTELFNEGTLYYFRYVRLFQLKDWKRTIRDTARNLRAFDLIHQYARREEDRDFLEKWRPYVIRVNASAAVMLELEKPDYQRALALAQEAIDRIDALDELDDDTFKFERERSRVALRELVAKIKRNRPLSEVEQLESQLRRAIDRQEFERAAELRDRIRALKKQQHTC